MWTGNTQRRLPKPRRARDYFKQLRTKQLAENEERIREALAPLVQATTDADERRRRVAVQHFQQTLPPTVLRVLAERLAEMLGRGTESARQAAASLIQLG